MRSTFRFMASQNNWRRSIASLLAFHALFHHVFDVLKQQIEFLVDLEQGVVIGNPSRRRRRSALKWDKWCSCHTVS
jgi:hypothetical protein